MVRSFSRIVEGAAKGNEQTPPSRGAALRGVSVFGVAESTRTSQKRCADICVFRECAKHRITTARARPEGRARYVVFQMPSDLGFLFPRPRGADA